MPRQMSSGLDEEEKAMSHQLSIKALSRKILAYISFEKSTTIYMQILRQDYYYKESASCQRKIIEQILVRKNVSQFHHKNVIKQDDLHYSTTLIHSLIKHCYFGLYGCYQIRIIVTFSSKNTKKNLSLLHLCLNFL